MTTIVNNLGELEMLLNEAFSDIITNWSGAPLVFLLSGDLGAGKTVVAQIIAKMFHVKHLLKSPTFIYVDEYAFQCNDIDGMIYHWDLWRLKKEDYAALKIVEKVVSNTVHLVEWWKRFESEFNELLETTKATVIKIDLRELDNPEGRVVVISGLTQ